MDSTDKNVNVPTWLVGVPLTAIFVVVSILNKGLAVSMTWGITLVPYFGAPSISVPLAIALTALATLIFPTPMDLRKDDRKPRIGLWLFVVFVNPWILYLIARIAVNA